MDGNGSVALVTGANKGIGREIAAALGQLGMMVILAVRDPVRAELAADTIRSRRTAGTDGADVRIVRIDVLDPNSVTRAAGWVEQEIGRLDVLVNNAGVSGDPRTQVPGGADLDVVRDVFATNVFGVIAVTEAMLPLLRRSPSARIVNMSSGVGSLARMSDPEDYFSKLPASLAYAPSKTALNQVTVQYAKALRPDGILVNAADPGACATDFTAAFPGLTRTAIDGAAIAVRLATLPADGPTGGFYSDAGPVVW